MLHCPTDLAVLALDKGHSHPCVAPPVPLCGLVPQGPVLRETLGLSVSHGQHLHLHRLQPGAILQDETPSHLLHHIGLNAAVYPDLVLATKLRLRVLEIPRELSVVGKEEETLATDIEAAHRLQVR